MAHTNKVLRSIETPDGKKRNLVGRPDKVLVIHWFDPTATDSTQPMQASDWAQRAADDVEFVLEGEEGYLQSPLRHYNYTTVAQFHAKQARYSDYDAEILHQKGVRPRFYAPLSQALRHFAWRFVTLHGYRDGLHGLRLSLLTAWYEGVTYRKLSRLWAD